MLDSTLSKVNRFWLSCNPSLVSDCMTHNHVTPSTTSAHGVTNLHKWSSFQMVYNEQPNSERKVQNEAVTLKLKANWKHYWRKNATDFGPDRRGSEAKTTLKFFWQDLNVYESLGGETHISQARTETSGRCFTRWKWKLATSINSKTRSRPWHVSSYKRSSSGAEKLAVFRAITLNRWVSAAKIFSTTINKLL